MENKCIEILGRVSDVEFPKSQGDPIRFNLDWHDQNKIIPVAMVRKFFPLREDDILNCVVEKIDNIYVIPQDRIPFVEPSTSEETLVRCFIKIFKKGTLVCKNLYRKIKNECIQGEDVSSRLTRLSKIWVIENDYLGIESLSDILSENEAKALLIWWHQERNLRRLYLLGLNDREINDSMMEFEDLYMACTTNPYTIPSISLETCDMIVSTLGLVLEDKHTICGIILRFINDCAQKRCWSCVPEKMIYAKYPNLDDFKPLLTKDFGVVHCEDKLQLSYPNKVENYISTFLGDLIKEDWVKYDTPLDTMTNGLIRRSANFTNPRLSDDQKQAIQGALDHRVSIITAPSGRGKCMAKGTKVLMYDGTFCQVENIKIGDRLMGPDSNPKTVLSLGRGRDMMFRVEGTHKRYFVCNSEHVLTLQGLVPFIKLENGIYNVHHSIYGSVLISSFLNYETASQFLGKLSRDIYDISLKDWMNLKEKKIGQLFHVSVEFGTKHTTKDPYWYAMNFDTVKMEKNYLINSYLVRFQVLKGIIERFSTNYKNIGYCIEFARLHPKLFKQIEFLVLSLGFMVETREDSFIIHKTVSFDFSWTPLQIDDYYGFELDGDGRYLLSDFMVTHNTTCIDQIIHNLKLRSEQYVVCSFTGKAVARVKEVTGDSKASTMDRLIANSKKLVSKRSHEPGVGGKIEHLIIDESSMVTTELFYRFIRAFPDIRRITFVGDINQLPPLGWGCLFNELIKSKRVPVYYLVHNHRFHFSNNSNNVDGIIANADSMIDHKYGDFEFISNVDGQPIGNFFPFSGNLSRVVTILKEFKKYGVDHKDIVILSPYNDVLPEINRKFQEIFTDHNPYLYDHERRKFNLGDRVMHKENDYEIDIFNGTEGFIQKIESDSLVVEFPGNILVKFPIKRKNPIAKFDYPQTKRRMYGNKSIDTVYSNESEEDLGGRTTERLDLSFAITVDKSQGSEYQYVIYYVPERFGNQSLFVHKNRTYTAITRSKYCCYVVGNLAKIKQGINVSPFNRVDRISSIMSSELPIIEPFNHTPKEIQTNMGGLDRSDFFDDEDDY